MKIQNLPIFGVLALASLTACDGLAGSGYQGDVLASVRGNIRSERSQSPADAQAVLIWTNTAGEPVGAQRVHEALLAAEAFASVQEVLARIDQVWTTHLAGMPADDDGLVLALGRG